MSELGEICAGEVVLVTGAGKGIGRHIALAFAEAGATVVLAARGVAELEETRGLVESRGRRALVVPTDIGDPDDVARMAATVVEEFGRVDALVCNSGVAGPTVRLWEVSHADWEETLRVNVTGTFLCCRAVLPGMLARKSGSVVVIGSMTGKRPMLGRTPYTTSKMALVGLVRTLAWEAGEFGVRVNLVSPGAVEGPRIDRVIEAQARDLGLPADGVRGHFLSASPLGRLTSPSDVAACVVFLASRAAGSITGEDLNVSAGVTMY